ncbi:peptidyl-prolyl cis-trans isomerase [Prosthecobacter sp. SYSU 5D2]|uniref:peptidyl-prolyl cis-trans isomerase n=1 Tax=Prosthecobacter sp. SYSU 5D2 TaxID=3134134 RepID=UPI0031FF1BF3
MLEFFRRHRGAFLITVTVIIIISFSVWGGYQSSNDRMQGQASDPAFRIYGRTYTIAEAQRLGRRMEAIYMLQMFDLLGLSRVGSGGDDQGNNIVLNQVVLEHEMERMGIHPSDAEAKAVLERLPAFQENGSFSPQRAANAEMMLNANGFSSADLLEIVKLSIGYSKLRDLVGSNYVASPLEAEKAYASEHQTLKVNTVTFNLEDFKKKAEVKDDEIQKYYDEQKDSYKTDEKRAISYVYFENPPADDKKPLEERQKAEKAVVERVNKFNAASIEPGAKFDTIVKDLKEKTLTADLFTQAAPPEALKAETELVNAIFANNPEVRPISDPVKGANGYYIFSVTKTEEPKQKELTEVKDSIKETLVAQKAQEELTKAVNEARTALVDGIKAGKKIADLAKEQKLTLSPQVDVTVAEPDMAVENSNLIARQAQDTPAGELSKVIDTETGALLVYVAAKELRKRDDSAALRENMGTSRADQERSRLFDAWFSRRREESKAKMLVTQEA